MLDRFLPTYDVKSQNTIIVRSTAARTFDAIQRADFSQSAIIRLLFGLRSIPARLSNKPGLNPKITLGGLTAGRFVELYRHENRTIVMGLIGRFWRPTPELVRIRAGEFVEFAGRRYAKAEWDFGLEQNESGVLLTTETRVRCLSIKSRLAFRFYWTFIGPFSSLIRKEMLRVIRNTAQSPLEPTPS